MNNAQVLSNATSDAALGMLPSCPHCGGSLRRYSGLSRLTSQGAVCTICHYGWLPNELRDIQLGHEPGIGPILRKPLSRDPLAISIGIVFVTAVLCLLAMVGVVIWLSTLDWSA